MSTGASLPVGAIGGRPGTGGAGTGATFAPDGMEMPEAAALLTAAEAACTHSGALSLLAVD